MPGPLRPNVILFFTDQQRWDSVGAYGASPLGLTPNLDALAARGTLFEHAFTCQPVCAPARACLQTGHWATQNGVWRNQIPLGPTQRTLGHWFRDAGYRTGYIGKWHLGPADPENDYDCNVSPEYRTGYDDWLASDILEFTSHPYGGTMFDGDGQPVDFSGYRVDALTDVAIGRIEGYAQSSETRPFFLTVSYIEPHQQNDMERLAAPNGYASRYRDFPHVPWDIVGTAGDWRRELPDYYGMIARLDEALGRMLAALERLGELENTVVLVLTVHGCHFRTRNSEYKRSPHDSSIRIPLVASGPGFDGGGVVRDLVSLIDVPPTLLEVAGAEPDPSMAGHSLLGLFDDRRAGWPDDVFVQISESMVGRAVRTDRWKYAAHGPAAVGWDQSGTDVYEDYCLYDLVADPWELDNLAGRDEYRAMVEEMRERLVARMRAAGESAPEIHAARR